MRTISQYSDLVDLVLRYRKDCNEDVGSHPVSNVLVEDGIHSLCTFLHQMCSTCLERDWSAEKLACEATKTIDTELVRVMVVLAFTLGCYNGYAGKEEQ
mgnify:CR=1 FL=1